MVPSFSALTLTELAVAFPEDFLDYSAKAMKNLANSGRSNVVYKLVKGLGTIREDGTDSCFPTKHMPMGLLEYMSDFYSCRHINSVRFVFHVYHSTNFLFSGDDLSRRLSSVAADNVRSFWSEVGKTIPWPFVEQ